jgi:Ca-activated chloride channel family protein
MKTITRRRLVSAALAGLLAAPIPLVVAQTAAPKSTDSEKDKDKDKDKAEEVIRLNPFCVEAGGIVNYASSISVVTASQLGATVGGAKDARYFRDAADRGEFPHPNTITAEGLFSEHDLPLKPRIKSRDLLVLTGEAMPAGLLTRPEVRYLAQIGFSSGLDASRWHRDPLNLVAVVDRSGSMSGGPLNLVKSCLHKVLSQLGPDDQLSIVIYGESSHVHLDPTRTCGLNKPAIARAIDAIESSGSTNMEEGLRVGFDLARESQRSFRGRTRVMQFTDERPNVGDTSARGFMGLMEAGSRDGIGQTTIGVGVEFGAELAAKVSSVRGGNLFFFPNTEEMGKTFDDEFETLVTELAHDLDLTIRPAAGLRLTGVYGIPGEMLKWEGDRNMHFHVSTLFLSKRRGAIYLAFAPEAEDLPSRAYVEGRPLASVRLSYCQAGREDATASTLELPLVAAEDASVGLRRGRFLVSEYLALKGAMTAHLIENDQEKAYRMLGELHSLLTSANDRSLRSEGRTVDGLFRRMSQLAGHGDELPDTEPLDTASLDDQR